MLKTPPMSRRAGLRRAGLLLGALTGWRVEPGHAQTKVTQTDAKYQTHPNGQQRCAICLQFEPPHRCKLVQGEITPHGWCQFFAARDNAR